jgi:hypothetical protein
MYVLILTALSV